MSKDDGNRFEGDDKIIDTIDYFSDKLIVVTEKHSIEPCAAH